ncbi:MAG: hypothetical protein DMF98_17240, partial [Acidobacteria bacterium]
RARSAYRFLPAFFFPPLAFFAIVSYPPLHVGVFARVPTTSPGGCRLARAPEIAAPRIGLWRDRLSNARNPIKVDELDELDELTRAGLSCLPSYQM